MKQQALLCPIVKEDILPPQLQEYVHVSYNEPHEHLSILFRIMESDEGCLAQAFPPPFASKHPFGYVHLNRIYHQTKEEYKRGRDRYNSALCKISAETIFDAIIHEILHLYFHARFEERDTFDYKKSDSYKPSNYNFTYARKWGSNERIVGALARVITETFFGEKHHDIKFAFSWLHGFTDLNILNSEEHEDAEV